MKIIFVLCMLLCTSIAVIKGQGIVAIPSFSNRQVTEQNNLVVLSTLGNAFDFIHVGDSIVVSTDLLPYLLMVEDTSTSTSELEHLDGLHVFPNPVPDILVIQREDQSEVYLVEIYSSEGMLVHRYNWATGINTYQPSLQSLPSGTYVLMITNSSQRGRNSYKIVKP